MQISNGTITVDSEVEKGMTFTVMLPLVEENTEYVAKAYNNPSACNALNMRSRHSTSSGYGIAMFTRTHPAPVSPHERPSVNATCAFSRKYAAGSSMPSGEKSSHAIYVPCGLI